MNDRRPDFESLILDLTEIPLSRLKELEDSAPQQSVLVKSLRRLLDGVDEPDSTIARFDASI